jgi:hypothetical protein
MPRNRLNVARRRVHSNRVARTFTFELASVSGQVRQQLAPLHAVNISSLAPL